MTLYQDAIISQRRELLARFRDLEAECASAEASFAHADDAERERVGRWLDEVTEEIEATAAALDAIDEAGFWRDR